MSKLWDEEEAASEYDLIAEDAQKAEELAEEYAAQPNVVEAEEEALEEISEESAFDLSHAESNVIYNARLRLEQAKLYEMLINHNLFDGVDASPDAIKNVQNELKFYIVKRLEILLGLREPVIRIKSSVAELPFNDVEIDFLKQLAFKGTFGKSENNQQVNKVKQQEIKPVSAPVAKLKTLAPKDFFKKEPVKTAPPINKKVESAPQAKAVVKNIPKVEPVKQQVVKKPKVGSSGLGRDLTAQEVEELAREEIKNAPKKPFHEMSASEKAERIREANERNKRPVAPKNAVPIPTAQELEMKYLNQQSSRGYSSSQSDQFNTILASALAANKNRGDRGNE